MSDEQLQFDALGAGDEPGSTAAHLASHVNARNPHRVPEAQCRKPEAHESHEWFSPKHSKGMPAAVWCDGATRDLSHPYAAVALDMWQAGWHGVLPLPAGLKAAPPVGWTGPGAPYPSYADVFAWTETHGAGNIALRMQRGEVYDTMAVDVDDYGDKGGAETLAKLEAVFGPLPATWRSTSRGVEGRGGKHLFRVPTGLYMVGGFPGIEILQIGHRYASVWPGTNPDAGGFREQWYDPSGRAVNTFPKVNDITVLPTAWVEGIRKSTPRAVAIEMRNGEVGKWLKGLVPGPPCGRMRNTAQRARNELTSRGHRSRHDVALEATRAIIALGGEGHAGAREVCRDLLNVFVNEVTRPGKGGMVREHGDAEKEFTTMVYGAVRLAAAKNATPRIGDPECIVWDDETSTVRAPEWMGAPTPPVPRAALAGTEAPPSMATPPEDRDTGSDDPARESATATAERIASGGVDSEDTTPPAPPEGGAAEIEYRPPLNVSNADVAAQWLRDNLGRGRLAGVFRRAAASEIVFTPMIGTNGYIEPAEGDDDGPAQVRPFSKEQLAARVQYTYACYKEREVTEREREAGKGKLLADGRTVVRSPGMFPLDSARTALNAVDMLPHLRRLAGVVHTPTVRKDGTILHNPGYDTSSHLLHLPQPGLVVPPVPKNPSRKDLEKARKILLHMLGDFPFVTTHDRAAYLGLLLTPLLRDITPAPYKMFAISAHQAGSGKTLLATLVRIIHGGVFKSEMPEDAPELRKQITTILQTTTGPVINFDNVTGVVRSSTLAGLLTSAEWDDRILGANDLARCVNDRVWVLTGNNMSLGGDMVRRTIWVNIDPGMPNPHLRGGFQIPNVEGWTRKNRGDLIHALLTLIRAWVAAGRPAETRSSDGYGPWIGAVNGILSVADIPGVCDEAAARGQAEGEDDAEWAGFLQAIERVFGNAAWSAREVLERVHTSHGLPGIDGLLARDRPIALDELPAELAEKLIKLRAEPTILTKSLGKWLANRKGRWAGGLVVREVPTSGKHASKWRVERYVSPTTNSD